MYCPSCRSEYRAGFSRCAHCDVDLVAELPPEDEFGSTEAMARLLADKEVQALLVGNHVDLGEAQRFLARARIPSVMAGEASEEIDAPVHQRFFLMVAADDLERARDLVHARWREGAIAQGMLLSDEAPAAGVCPACGAAVSLSAQECPDCGLFVGDAAEEEGAPPPDGDT
jgi:hypothetical protein